jgi:hypothetical protein
MKNLSYEVLERIEGLILITELEIFKRSLHSITDDLVNEDFTYSEIKAYFQLTLDEVLGKFDDHLDL